VTESQDALAVKLDEESGGLIVGCSRFDRRLLANADSSEDEAGFIAASSDGNTPPALMILHSPNEGLSIVLLA
jgi:hypothetical protein